jgi:mRNA-degrading endonuclease RelE of RelBE toxin-antitoxin system
MSFNVIPTDHFKKAAKRLVKKFPSLKEELAALNQTLQETPETGTPLGNNTYKIRLAVQSKGKGKSGGTRVITYIVTDDNEVYLLTIFDKSEFDSISKKMLKSIIDNLQADKS